MEEDIKDLEMDLEDIKYCLINYFGNKYGEKVGTTIENLLKGYKTIDKMTDTLKYYCGEGQDRSFCEEICRDKYCDKENCKGRIIQYFEKKVGE